MRLTLIGLFNVSLRNVWHSTTINRITYCHSCCASALRVTPITLNTFTNSCKQISTNLQVQSSPSVVHLRYKSDRGRKRPVEDEEEENEDITIHDEEVTTKTATVYVPSLRVDVLLKAAFGIARNKSETAFYQNRVYVNGKAASKKNLQIGLKDEIDLVRGVNQINDKFIDVMRLEIVDILVPKGGENIAVKLNRFKLLTVENYTNDPWSGPNEN